MKTHDVAIIGAGPAGITAAIQLKRSGINPLLLEREKVGGLLLNANLVENYPGFPEGVTGEELVQLMVWHIERAGVGIMYREIMSVWQDGDLFILEDGNESLRTKQVIVASGTTAIIPDDIPISSSLIGDKIFCEIKDISPSPGMKVGIIGGGDCAFDYALNLADKGCSVSILHRGDRPQALGLLVDRFANRAGGDYISGVVIKEIEENERGVILHMVGEEEKRLEVDFLLLAVGRIPQDTFLSPGIREVLESGKGIDGLYLAGDVRRGLMRQAGIAIGDGLMAAMDICRSLKGQG